MSIKDLKNTTVMSVQKFHTKYWIEGTYYSCSWRKRFNCDQCGKNFARRCYLKVYIEIVHEKTLNSIVITVAKISPNLSWIRQNTGLKLLITAVHENEKIQFWILINVAKILLEDAIWMIMKLIHELNSENLFFWIWN